MKQTATARNNLVDILRLVFALLVVLYHFYFSGSKLFTMGRLGVEYFVILSGFLFYSAWDRFFCRDGQLPSLEPMLAYWKGYMYKRYNRFFWNSLIAFLFSFIVVRIWLNNVRGGGTLLDWLSGDIWEILLIKFNGMNRGQSLLNVPAWTLHCMLLAEFFILGMLVWCRRFFLAFFMPLSLLSGFAYWINANGVGTGDFIGLFTFGALRVYLLTSMGIVSYILCQKLNQFRFTSFGKTVMTTAEWSAYILVLLIAGIKATRYYQMCAILLLTLAFAISFSSNTWTARVFSRCRIAKYTRELSLAVYLTHNPILRIFQKKTPDPAVREQLLPEFLVTCLVVAVAFSALMRLFFKYGVPIGKKIKHLLVEDHA